MKLRTVAVLGAGIAYLFGTESGRRQKDQAVDWVRRTWDDPRVQDAVHDLTGKADKIATEYAPEWKAKLDTALKHD